MIYKCKNFIIEIDMDSIEVSDSGKVFLEYSILKRSKRATKFKIKKVLKKLINKAVYNATT